MERCGRTYVRRFVIVLFEDGLDQVVIVMRNISTPADSHYNVSEGVNILTTHADRTGDIPALDFLSSSEILPGFIDPRRGSGRNRSIRHWECPLRSNLTT